MSVYPLSRKKGICQDAKHNFLKLPEDSKFHPGRKKSTPLGEISLFCLLGYANENKDGQPLNAANNRTECCSVHQLVTVIRKVALFSFALLTEKLTG